MDTISWEDTQNIANNMLKATDNPDELLMLYLFKLHSLYLDTPVELHHHFAQSLLNTGMLDDPVLKNLYGEFLNDEVSDVKQYDVLTHNMPQMLEAYGGYRRSKLNKRKNKSAGNSGEEKKSNALVPKKGPGAMVVANRSAQDNTHRDLFDEWQISEGVRAIKMGDKLSVQIVNNPMYKYLIIDIDNIKKQCKQDYEDLLRQRDERLSELDSQIEKRKQEIKIKFRREVNKLYSQIGLDILFWLLGALIVYGLKSTPAWHYPSKAVEWVASKTIGEQILWSTEYILIAGVIGGIIKAMIVSDYSLSVSDLVAQDTNKGKALAALQFHPILHISKLLSQRFNLPGEEDIFELSDFRNYVAEIEKKKQDVRDHYEDLILKLRDKCNKLIKDAQDQLIRMGQDTTNIEIEQSFIEDQQKRNQQQLIESNSQLLITDTGTEKKNGGMKKKSKKYLKKTRKSRY